MSTVKRSISLLLALLLVLGMFPWDTLGVAAAGFGEAISKSETPVETAGGLLDESAEENSEPSEATEPVEPIEVTRAQWLQMLVEVFGYSIECGIIPDNYYPDLSEDADYYEDILVAVYYGLVDVLPNSPLSPEAAASREFAANTLNACMGYLAVEEPSFTEAAEVTYPNDIQVSIEQGWFTLSDGAFLPEQAVTAEEFDLLKAVAESHVEDFTIEPGVESQYVFKEGIIEITDEAVIATVDEVTTVTIVKLSQGLTVGDKFVIYSDGLAIPYMVEEIALDGVNTVITTSELTFEDAIDTMLVQQEVDTDPANYRAAEDTELIFIEESTGEEYSQQAVMEQMASGSKSVYIPKFSKKIDLGDNTSFTLSVELKNAKVGYDVDIGLLDGDAAVWLDANVEVSGKVKCDLSKFSNTDIEIPVGSYEIPGVGGLSIVVKADATGSFSVVKKYHMMAGIRVRYDVLKLQYKENYLFDLTDKGSTVNAEISAKIYLEAKLGLYGKALPIKGYLYAEGGFKTKLKRTTYSEIDGNCTHFTAHMYAEYGAKLEWGFLGFKNTLDWNYELIKESNSPVKIGFHYEDGKQVNSCTRKDLTGSSTGDSGKIGESGYTTGSDSSYSGSGLSSGGSSTGYGSDGEPVVIYTYTLDAKNNATITGYQGNATSLTIPLMLDGYNVTAIGSNAFKNKTSLRTVIMQDNILSVGDSAFYGCDNLRNLTFSENLTTIGSSAFRNCSSLLVVDIPDSVTAIQPAAFGGCTSLSVVSLSSNLTTLGSSAFHNCDRLTEITLPKTIENVPSTQIYDYPSVTYGAVFAECDNLKNVYFEDGTITIHQIMNRCNSIESISIPSTVTEIGYKAFQNCTSLKTVDIPDSVVAIQSAAFGGCTELTDVVLPPNLTTLGSSAFHNCDGLTEITLPKTITNIPSTQVYDYPSMTYGKVFAECDNLQSVEFEDGTHTIYRILNSCPSVEDIIIPDSVTKIGEYAFSACTSLKVMEIPASITSIGNNAFSGCTDLQEIVIPDTVTSIGNSMFSDCTSMERAVIHDSIAVVPDSTFMNCISLVEVSLPDTMTSIKPNAFKNCDSLSSFVIPKKVSSLGNSCFFDCDNLISITIPYGVTIIGSSAFYDCDALETVEMANSVTSLGSSAFKHCDVLKNVELSRNLTTIPSEAFRECAELEQIVIPYFTTKIEANAFNSSPKLKKVVTHEKLASINSSAFSYADRTVFYGPIGSYAETWCADNGYTFNENTATTASVTPAESAVSIPKGKTYMLDFDIDPIDFSEVITTKSSNTAVATVDETGKITAVAPGTATIKIVVGDASASCKVTVTQAVTKITLDKTSLSLDVPETYQFTATVTPTDASNKTVNWTSSNTSAATVDSNGLVTAVGNGTAVITAEAADGSGVSASCTVTVIDPSNIPVSGITLDKTSLSLEAMETYQLTASVSPSNAANKSLIWSSSDEAVATVDSNGQVTAVAKGTATITATAADGYGAVASCTVTVTNNGYVVTSLDHFQSSHPYENSCTDFWLYTQPGAGSLSITFDAETEMEDGFDFLYIYNGNGALIGKYTGMELANQTITIPGDTVKVQIESDDSGNAWGFCVTNVDYTDHTHSFTDYVSDGNATCTEDGTKTAKCDYCDVTDTIPDERSALDHDMGDWATVTAATCTENGEEQRSCVRCDHSESRTVEATGHRWDEGVITREPTEETEGEKLYTCTACGQTKTERIPVLGHEHSYEAVVTEPACTDQGYTTYTCKCGESYVADYVDALGHDMGEWDIVSEATCTENGEERRSCSRCGHSESRTIEATGHSFGEWTVIQEPTTTEEGMEERTCDRCGHAEQRTIAKLENPFSDVAPGSFYYEPVMWAIENGITNGTSATTFGPNDQCMRAHVVTFLWRAVGCPEPTTTENPFVDVKPTDFYYKPVLWALENGITSGMDATHFGPTAYCNRAQVVTFIHRTKGSPAPTTTANPFTDVIEGSWYYAPVLWAVENGVTSGMSATTFAPNSICNRAQIVTFLYRAFH